MEAFLEVWPIQSEDDSSGENILSVHTAFKYNQRLNKNYRQKCGLKCTFKTNQRWRIKTKENLKIKAIYWSLLKIIY